MSSGSGVSGCGAQHRTGHRAARDHRSGPEQASPLKSVHAIFFDIHRHSLPDI
jgi:hypothetical protein